MQTMTQEEILEFLKKTPKEFSISEGRSVSDEQVSLQRNKI